MPSKAFSGKLKEFRNRFEIPVGVAVIDVPKIGGKFVQFPSHFEARPVPLNEPPSRETVPKMLKPWSTTGTLTPSGYPQADRTGHQSVVQGAHLAPPGTGHGRATSRNASKRTWA